MNTTPMPKPLDAPLLIDDPEHGDRDERFDSVHLLEVDADGEAKTTAERVANGWKIADWELTEELDGALAGSRYWFCRSWHTVPAAHIDRLVALADPPPHPPLPPPLPEGWQENGNKALAHISNALDDLQYSPDQRPVPLLNEAMHHIRAMLRSA